MARERSTTESDTEDESPNVRILVAGGVFLFLAGAASGSMLYAFGIAGRHFDVSLLRGGLLTFGITSLIVAACVGLMSLAIQVVSFLWPRSISHWKESRLLKRTRQKTLRQLQRRQELQEERARLTAKMQATLVMEKESARLSNQKALQELRGALQTSMVRSCEIVFDHLNQTLEQYEDLVAEIDASSLPPLEKKELLDTLSKNLNVESFGQKRQSAQLMMETAIWDVRFRKARMLARREVNVAVTYLKKIRTRTESHRVLLQIDALIQELTAS